MSSTGSSASPGFWGSMGFFGVWLGGHSQGSQDCLAGQEEKEGQLDQHQGLSHPSYKPVLAGRARCDSIPRAGTTSLDQAGATAVGASLQEPLSSRQLPQVVGSPLEPLCPLSPRSAMLGPRWPPQPASASGLTAERQRGAEPHVGVCVRGEHVSR